ncbi:mycofactocin biosynthesis glycosyltransferase MftF [soil metagenome]
MTEAGDGLPAGWSVTLDPEVRRTDAGRTLIGGTPLRVLRFTEAGARWLGGLADGGGVPGSEAARTLARRLVDGGQAVPHPVAPVQHTAADVAVVVPVRDDPDGLRATLASLGDVGEVVVVDDGSLDADAVRRVVAERPGTVVLRNEASGGPASARQRGWRTTDRAVVAFVDAEVQLPAGWLTALVAHLDAPGIAAVAPRIRAAPGDAPGWLHRYESARFPLDLGPLAGPVRPGARVSYVPTTVLVVRRDALERVGGFDEALRVGEDVDLVWRLVDQGLGVRFEPAVAATHPCRPGATAALRQRFAYGTSAASLAARHGGAGAPLGISRLSGVAWLAALVGHPELTAVVAVGTTAALVPKLESVDHPISEAVRIGLSGHGHAGAAVAEALRRTWLPLVALFGGRVRRARPALVAAVVVPHLLEWRTLPTGLDPVRWTALRVADDLAYGTGVWAGCLRARSARALLPRFAGAVGRPAAP